MGPGTAFPPRSTAVATPSTQRLQTRARPHREIVATLVSVCYIAFTQGARSIGLPGSTVPLMRARVRATTPSSVSITQVEYGPLVHSIMTSIPVRKLSFLRIGLNCFRQCPGIGLVTLLILCCGCTGHAKQATSSAATHPGASWSTETIAALSDGKVTETEYHEAFLRYQSCLAAGGFELANVSDRGVRIDFAVPRAAVDSGQDRVCYSREFQPIDMKWQVENPDPADTKRYVACLRKSGLAVPATQEEMISSLLSHNIDPGTCGLTGRSDDPQNN